VADEEPVQEEQPQVEAAEGAPVEGGEGGDEDVALARIPDRFLAYAIDALIFLIPCEFTLAKFSPQTPVPRDFWFQWHYGWLAAYTLYQTILNAGEGTTLGKRILGLRVVTTDGDSPGFVRSLVRAVLYIPCGAFFELGFALALTNPMRRGLHDLLAGTVVLEAEERSSTFRSAATAGSLILFAILGFLSLKTMMYRTGPAGRAQDGLAYVSGLEEQYKAKTGYYTEDVAALSNLAGSGKTFKAAVLDTIQPQGFGIKVEDGKYYLQAVALDGNPVRRRGPQ
jgi:uncharacterized RDD family membrane protein YckC